MNKIKITVLFLLLIFSTGLSQQKGSFNLTDKIIDSITIDRLNKAGSDILALQDFSSFYAATLDSIYSLSYEISEKDYLIVDSIYEELYIVLDSIQLLCANADTILYFIEGFRNRIISGVKDYNDIVSIIELNRPIILPAPVDVEPGYGQTDNDLNRSSPGSNPGTLDLLSKESAESKFKGEPEQDNTSQVSIEKKENLAGVAKPSNSNIDEEKIDFMTKPARKIFENMNVEELIIELNSIYASYGLIFKTDAMKEHFSKDKNYEAAFEEVEHFLSSADREQTLSIKSLIVKKLFSL